MRIRSVALSALVGCLALLVGAPPSRTQIPVTPPGDHGRGARTRSAPALAPAPLSGGAEEQFRALDRNGDGLLSFDEMPEPLRAERDRWDVNRDGFIDLAEWGAFVEAFKAQQRRWAADSAATGRNPGPGPRVWEAGRRPHRTGAIPPPPGEAWTPGASARPPFRDRQRPGGRASSGPGRYPKNIPAWFREYDTDGDGQVGLYEWRARGDSLAEFKKYDLNDDGFITVEELIQSGQFLVNTPAPATAIGLRAEPGDFFYFEVAGSQGGAVWGTDVYTADSSIAAAAVHAGVLQVGQTGFVKVTILPGQGRYEGSVRNGVATQEYGAFPRSFRVEAAR